MSATRERHLSQSVHVYSLGVQLSRILVRLIPFDLKVERTKKKNVSFFLPSTDMEASQATTTENPNPNPNPGRNLNSISSSSPVWPTIDGSLGLSEEESLSYARRFYNFGFLLLPLLWAVNCFYFWPVLRHSRSFPRIHYCMCCDLRFPFKLVLFLCENSVQFQEFSD